MFYIINISSESTLIYYNLLSSMKTNKLYTILNIETIQF